MYYDGRGRPVEGKMRREGIGDGETETKGKGHSGEQVCLPLLFPHSVLCTNVKFRTTVCMLTQGNSKIENV